MKGLRRLAAALALAACAGCGGGEKPAESDWTPVVDASAAPPAPAASAGSTAAARADLDAAVGRAQRRIAQAPAIVQLMNPMGGTVDLPEAARRCRALLAECRADQKKLGEIADVLADAGPDPARAPLADLLARQRAAAYRFREWALLELLRAVESSLADLNARGTPGTAELLLAAGQLDSLTYGHEGAILVRRWLELAPEALRRATDPEQRADGVAALLTDCRLMGYAWGPNQWRGRDREDVRAHVAAFRKALAALPTPEGRLAASVVTRWWDVAEKTNGGWPDASTAAELTRDIRTLGQKLPASVAGLEALAVEVSNTVAR